MRIVPIIRLLAIILFAFGVSQLPLAAGNPSAGSVDWQFHSVIPLGYEAFVLRPDGASFNMIGSVESAEFDGVRRVVGQHGKLLLMRSGAPLRHYPARLTFRITASGLDSKLIGSASPTPGRVDSAAQLNDFLLNIGFRLKVFDALDSRQFAPVSVRQIGMPADVVYPERIYQISFDLQDVPTDQRLVLEVYSPEGERFCRFHLDLL